MGKKENLLDLLDRTHQETQDFIASLTGEQRAQVGAADDWSAKDLVAHITTWNERLIDRHEAAARGEPIPTYGPDDHENAQIFEAHRDWSWDAIQRKMDEVHDRLTRLVQTTSEADLTDSQRFEWLRGAPLWRRIAGDATHVLIHLGQFSEEHGNHAYAEGIQQRTTDPLLALDNSPEWRGVTLYNLACYHALAGRHDTAIEQLGEALRLNPGLIEWSKQDPDFNGIRSSPAYQALYA